MDAMGTADGAGLQAGTHNVLLVDDRAENLLALEASLEGLGQNLVKVQSGKEALRELLRREFALILLDVNMPEMDGFETASLIRQRQRTAYTPIIFLTADSDELQAARGYELGAVDYLFTPLVPEVLRAKVGAFIDLARKTDAIRRQEEWLRSAAERKAEHLESRFVSLLNLLDVGFFRCTEEGELLEANPAFERMSGLRLNRRPARAQVRHLREGGAADLELWRMPAPGANGGELPAQRFDVELLRPDGRSSWVSISLTSRRHPGGEPCVEGLLTDIDARKRAEEALQRSNAALRRSNEDLNQFVYAASHDLQEPLRMVTSYTQLLQRAYEGRLDPQADQFIRYAVEGATRMRVLLRDLLEYLHAADDGGALPAERVNCAEALAKVLLNLETSIRQSGAAITHDDLPPVRAHEVHVVQVLQNLISNAIKYRSEAPPGIHVSALRDGGAWTISVRDNGLGFEPEYAEQVFGLFKRLHGQKYPGTGIGLALCTKLVERYGGRIWAESEPGKGSIFRFTLPAWSAQASDARSAPPAATAAPAT